MLSHINYCYVMDNKPWKVKIVAFFSKRRWQFYNFVINFEVLGCFALFIHSFVAV